MIRRYEVSDAMSFFLNIWKLCEIGV